MTEEWQGLTRFRGGSSSFDCTTAYTYITYGYNISSNISCLSVLYHCSYKKTRKYFFIKFDEAWLQLINLTKSYLIIVDTNYTGVPELLVTRLLYSSLIAVQYFHSCQLQVISISFVHNSVFFVCTILLNMNVVHFICCTYNFYLQAKLSGFNTRLVSSCMLLQSFNNRLLFRFF